MLGIFNSLSFVITECRVFKLKEPISFLTCLALYMCDIFWVLYLVAV